jgi:hypothetical protein
LYECTKDQYQSTINLVAATDGPAWLPGDNAVSSMTCASSALREVRTGVAAIVGKETHVYRLRAGENH